MLNNYSIKYLKSAIFVVGFFFVFRIFLFSESEIEFPSKYFKRYKHFHSIRNYSKLPPAIKLYKELEAIKSKSFTNNSIHNSSDWESIGPFHFDTLDQSAGLGRINKIAIDPLDTNHILIGAASGGLWQSYDYGANWREVPLTDFLSLGISDIQYGGIGSEVIYAATGDHAAYFFGCFSIGIIKSIDNGKSWQITNLAYSLDENLIIPSIAVNESNSNELVAATNKGIFLSKDGGDSFIQYDSSNFYFDVKRAINEDTYLATTFEQNGGAKVRKIEIIDDSLSISELFELPFASRIELEISQASPGYVFALATNALEQNSEGFYYSSDDGDNWREFNLGDNDIVEAQGNYNLSLENAPYNRRELIAGGVTLETSSDQGKNWNEHENQRQIIHVDHHDFVITDEGTYYSANDGGIYRSYDKGNSWTNISNGLAITQFYRLGLHPNNNNLILAGAQDNVTNILLYDKRIPLTGGDGMECFFDPIDPNIIYTSIQNGRIYKSSQSGINQFETVFSGDEASPWLIEYNINPHNPDELFIGTDKLYKYNNGALDTIFDPKLNNSHITSIEFLKENENIILLSYNNKIFASFDKGDSFNQIREVEGYITDSKIINERMAIFTLGGYGNEEQVFILHLVDNYVIHVANNLPDISILCVELMETDKELPNIIIGTDVGVFIFDDQNLEWNLLGEGLPNVIINELEYSEEFHELVVASWGRGLWKYKFSTCDIETPVIKKPDLLEFCKGESIGFEIENYNEKYTYTWSDGTNGRDYKSTKSEYVYVSASDETACYAASDQYYQTKMNSNDIDVNLTLFDRNPSCEGDSIKIALTFPIPEDFQYQWSNGQLNVDTIYSKKNELIYLEVFDSIACTVRSDTISTVFLPLPEKPQIYRDGSFIKTDSDLTHFWYKDGERMRDYSGNSIYIEGTGVYTAEVINEDFCRSATDTVVIASTNKAVLHGFDYKIYPNPTFASLKVDMFFYEIESVVIKIFDLTGRSLFSKKVDSDFDFRHLEIDLSNYSQGTYYISANNIYKKFVIQR